MALLLAVSGWGSDAFESPDSGRQETEDTARAAQVLLAAGWRVAVATARTPLVAAWQQLHRPVGKRLIVTGSAGSAGAYP
jgi:hypothetical protein